MSVQYSTAVRNAILDAIEVVTGSAAKLLIYTGAQPANCAASAAGSLLATIALPSDWMNAASGGTKTLAGSWSVAASGTGNAGHYRIVDNAGTTCHEQGSITATGGGGDITLDNISLASGQTVTITAKTITAGNP